MRFIVPEGLKLSEISDMVMAMMKGVEQNRIAISDKLSYDDYVVLVKIASKNNYKTVSDGSTNIIWDGESFLLPSCGTVMLDFYQAKQWLDMGFQISHSKVGQIKKCGDDVFVRTTVAMQLMWEKIETIDIEALFDSTWSVVV